MRRFAILISLVGIVWVAGGAAQSPNPFGIPSADQPTPAAAIDAVAGSRAQGWLAQGRSEVLARHGIVATSDPLAAQAGVEILRQGGNAIDAAVAAGAVLDVTSQNDTGIGGDLFALVWSARDKKLYALNSGGWAPAAWTPQFFTERLGVKTVPGSGVNSATVPGAISGYDALLKRFGSMTFEQTFERAARIAEEGWGQAERRHADLRSADNRIACGCRFAPDISDRRPRTGPVQHHPQSSAREGASSSAEAGARRFLSRGHRCRHRRKGAGQWRCDDEGRSRRIPIGVGRADFDDLSRLRRLRAAAAGAGIRGAADAEHSRRVRAEAGRESREAGSVRPDVLAPDGRSQETGVLGSVRVQRRSEVCRSAGRQAPIEIVRGDAVRSESI